MALIKCPECGKEFSDKAAACPNCGCPISEIKKMDAEEREKNIFELELENSHSLKCDGETIEIYYKDSLLFSDSKDKFVLNYNKEEEDYGRMQLKVVFSHRSYGKPLKICANKESARYQKAKKFSDTIANVCFIKDMQMSYYDAGAYAIKHVDPEKIPEPRRDTDNEMNSYEKETKVRYAVGKENNKSFENFYNELAHLPGFYNTGIKKEAKHLYEILYDDEKVYSVTSGVMNVNTWMIACTNKRIVFIDKGMLYGVKHSEIMIDKINSISYKNGILLGEIHIEDGATTRAILNVDKKSTKPFVDATHRVMDMSRSKNNYNHSLNTISIADEILKLKSLMDGGILTKEEFEIQKKRLLNQ